MHLGEVISGKYRLLRLVGDGGMGSVYEAHHEGLGTRVAIKVLHEDLAQKPGLVDRFLREARVSAQIQSQHVVRVLDVDKDAQGRAYIVMELLTGESLSAVLGREKKLPPETAVLYAGQILDALAAAHSLGVIHRDLKPENVFITKDPQGKPCLKLIDFGIAKVRAADGTSANLTVTGTMMGTPEYMAPEQARSADLADARSDVYAVGVMLYELLAGSRPLEGSDARVVALKVERGEVVPLIHAAPDIPRDLAGLVHRAMAPRPEMRFASAAEMRRALEALGTREPKPVATSYRPPATGTILGEPAGALIAAAPYVPPGGATGYGEPAGGTGYAPPAGQGYPGQPPAQGWAPPPPPAYGSTPPGPRGRRRGGGGAVWLVGGIAALLFGGLGVAALLGAFSPGNPTATTSTPEPTSTPTAAPQPSATETAPVPDPLDQLDTPPSHPLPHAISDPRPHPPASSGPHPPPSAPSAAPGTPFPPFGLPPGFPTAFPTAIPNPFPTPASSGVGPVQNFPGFPPFGGPPAPAKPPPAASGSGT